MTDTDRLSCLPRWLHALYALLTGYFWLPCPDCGRMIGGHEDWEGVKPTDRPGIYQGVCRLCAPAYYSTVSYRQHWKTKPNGEVLSTWCEREGWKP